MAVTIKRSENLGSNVVYEYSGLSSDTKPSNVPVNTLFLELDTGDFYYFDGEDWEKVGSGGSEPSGDGYEITNPVLTLNISGDPIFIDGASYVDENGYLTWNSINDANGETKVVVIRNDEQQYKVTISIPSSYSNEVNCTVESGLDDTKVIIITDPTQDASIDVVG